jgi:predicted nucleotidyltransferase
VTSHRRILDNSLSSNRGYFFGSQAEKSVQFLIQEKKMTQAHKPQQHHEKAAEHHEQAAKHHKEAVKHHESGDEKTAAHHAHIAHGHSAQATEQETEASKKYAETHSPKK